jgi:hypothetical protein
MEQLSIGTIISPLNKDISGFKELADNELNEKIKNRNQIVKKYFEDNVNGKYLKYHNHNLPKDLTVYIKVRDINFDSYDCADYFMINGTFVNSFLNDIEQCTYWKFNYNEICDLSFVSEEEYNENYNKLKEILDNSYR